MARSIEEQVEDWAKAQLVSHNIKYYPKTDKVNEVIGDALKQAPSKQGGGGVIFLTSRRFSHLARISHGNFPLCVKSRDSRINSSN